LLTWTSRSANAATANDSLVVIREVSGEKVLALLQRDDLVSRPVRGHCRGSC
jgi:hypothetical protein